MNIPERDAGTKWCPMVRVSGLADSTHTDMMTNRGEHGQPPVNTRCIGSACMMWRKSNAPGVPSGSCGLTGAAG